MGKYHRNVIENMMTIISLKPYGPILGAKKHVRLSKRAER